jgi:hypothetical protein
MRRKLIKLAFRWEECSLSEYIAAYSEFGGNTISNPLILDYISKNFDVKTRYFIHRTGNGFYDAAVATWDNVIAGDKKIARLHGINIPVSFDEVIIPCNSLQKKIIIPFGSKALSSGHSSTFINASAQLNSGREVCIVKQIQGKSRQTLNRQLNQFLKGGGEVHQVRNISTDDFHDIYSELFYKRRNKLAEEKQTKHFMNNVDDVMFGQYLSLNGKPCAAQVITKTEDSSNIYLDYINSGRDVSISEYSLGTICMWVNIKSAFEYAQLSNKKLRFNFGNPTHDYKDRFCVRHKLMRAIA